MCSKSFIPATEIPNLQGKVILVTGGNNGLGKQAILEYARHGPAEIWMASRNLEKADEAIREIRDQIISVGPMITVIKPLQLDLSSLDSVQQAAHRFLSEAHRLDILMLNAGIMACPPGLTKDGYEVQFGTNHLGHALFAKLLLPILKGTAANNPSTDVRCVVVCSDAHAMGPKAGVMFDTLKTPAEKMGPMERYGQSKTASILWVRHMAQMHRDIKWASLHPGIVATNLQANADGMPGPMRFTMKVAAPLRTTVGKGVLNQLWASVSHDVKSGEYYTPVGVGGKASKAASDMVLAEKVAQWTDTELHRFMY